MRRTPLAGFFVSLLCAASFASGQTVVNSTFLGGDHNYSNAANWLPMEVPNNSIDKSYNVTLPSFLYLDIDATVTNLTVSGYFESPYGHSYTVVGAATVDPTFGLLQIDYGAFRINGALSTFDSTTKTLTGGRYFLTSAEEAGAAQCILQFPNADVVNNGAGISLFGPTAIISDNFGADALRNFARNLSTGSFAIGGRDYTVSNRFTNDGTLSVSGGLMVGGSLTMLGGLTNYDPQAKRLSGGSYEIAGSSGSTSGIPSEAARLIVPGADIVRNSASITLAITGALAASNASFTDEHGNNALRNFSHNEPAGVFNLRYISQPFQIASDFTNAGRVDLILSSLTLPSAHVYRQMAGRTTLEGGNITGNVEILAGELVGVDGFVPGIAGIYNAASIVGNVTVGEALVDPSALNVSGSMQLSDASRFFVQWGFTHHQLSVNSTLSLAGTLEIAEFTGEGTIAHAAAISGVFKNAPNGTRVTTLDGRGSFVISYTSTDVTLTDFQPTPPNARLLNISTRAQVLTGDAVAIGGFIVTGSEPKNVVMRAIGPSLALNGVFGPLQDPVIELHDSKGALVTMNDNWRDTQEFEVTGAGVIPSDFGDSAIFATLSPGAYTAVVRGKNNTTGVALVDVYDLSSGSPSKLANISTRGFVDADHVLIGGLIAGGNAPDTVHVVVRGIGSGVQSSGVPNFLPDAALEVRDKDGALLTANDDFGTPADSQSSVPKSLWPANTTDAATGVTLSAGNYTVIVSGKGGASGNALVEIYDLTQ